MHISNETSPAWFSLLSKAQKIILLISTILAVIVICVALLPNKQSSKPEAQFNTNLSIKEIAPKLGITGKALARELKLPLDTPKGKPLKSFNITEKELTHVIEHQLSHTDAHAKYPIFLALVLWGLVFLAFLGRPAKATIQQRKSWYPRTPYLLCLVTTVTLAGFYLGKSPNPMEGAVKVFKSMVGLYPDPVAKVTAFLFFLTLAIMGNKLICGWACPFGALQELFYSVPFVKKKKIPFMISNIIRISVFIIMLLFLFAVIGKQKGLVIYHYINPFNLFNGDFEEISVLIAIVTSLIGAFVIYRPFCLFICPFGLLSWLAEHISLFRIRIDNKLCHQCNACVRACPTDSCRDLVAGKTFVADCYSCGRCLGSCPQNAIKYAMTSEPR